MKKNTWLGMSLLTLMITAGCSLGGTALKGDFYGGGAPVAQSQPASGENGKVEIALAVPQPGGQSVACFPSGSIPALPKRSVSFNISNGTSEKIRIDNLGFYFKGEGMKDFAIEYISLKIDNTTIPLSNSLLEDGVIYFNLKEQVAYEKIESQWIEANSSQWVTLTYTEGVENAAAPKSLPIEISAVYGKFLGRATGNSYEYSNMQAEEYKTYVWNCTKSGGGESGQGSEQMKQSCIQGGGNWSGTYCYTTPIAATKKCAYAAKNGIPGIGAPILAKWNNGYQWYPGKISKYTEIGSNEYFEDKDFSFSIDYDDGGKESDIGCNQMAYFTKHPKSVTPGQKVVIFSNDSNAYWSAQVVSFENGMVTVSYDDEPTKNKTVDLSLVWIPLE